MLRPLHKYLIVETIEHETRRENKERIPSGKVIAVSNQITDLAINATIIFSRNSGEYVNYGSKVFLLLAYEDILAVIEEN